MQKIGRLERALPWLYVVGGGVGLLAAFILTEDTFRLQQNPAFHPSCSINPIISCGSVMKTATASTFGFPNPFIGLVAFGSLLTIGLALLAGAHFARWFWLGVEAAAVLGVVFVHYLFFHSVYVIGALCPYCILVWVVTIAVFWYTTLYNLRAGYLKLPAGAFARRHHADIAAGWLVLLTALILQHFWNYFGRFLGQ